MPRPSPVRSVEHLRDKRARLEAELAALREAEAALEERRFALAGRVALAAAAHDDHFREQLMALLDRALSRKRDRRLFDLPQRQTRSPASVPPGDPDARTGLG